jgi:hypothetical protein
MVDPASPVDPGNHSCHNTPQKPNQPRKWCAGELCDW